MGLRFKFFLQQVLILATLAAVGSVALLGLLDLRRLVRSAEFAHTELQRAQWAQAQVAAFLRSLGTATATPVNDENDGATGTTEPGAPPTSRRTTASSMPTPPTTAPAPTTITSGRAVDLDWLHVAVTNLRLIMREEVPSPHPSYAEPVEFATEAMSLLDEVRFTAMNAGAAADRAWLADRAELALSRVGQVVSGFRTLTRTVQAEADARVRAVLWNVALIATGGMIVLLGAGYVQYISLVSPLAAIRDAVRGFAADKTADPVVVHGDRDLVALAGDFNSMASALDAYSRDLEEQVARKSRDLVRSERLASVGYLAAGVAHEINNPLGIISGYAELSLRPLQKLGDHPAAADAIKSLEIIRDEAFRCKQITSKLLSLAKGSGEARARVSLAQVARDVAEIVRGLGRFRDRTIALDLPPDASLDVWANTGEMKQVLLNLIVNALEATRPDSGTVTISGRPAGAGPGDRRVELSVRDNGRGMTARTLERIFEPFYSDRPGARTDDERGLGLGLSISNAIVENHGGRLRATSDGPDRGSCFTIELPPAGEAATPVAAPAVTVVSPSLSPGAVARGSTVDR